MANYKTFGIVVLTSAVGVASSLMAQGNDSPYRQSPNLSPYKQFDPNKPSPYRGSSATQDRADQEQFDARIDAERLETKRLEEQRLLRQQAEADAKKERSAEQRANKAAILNTLTQSLKNLGQSGYPQTAPSGSAVPDNVRSSNNQGIAAALSARASQQCSSYKAQAAAGSQRATYEAAACIYGIFYLGVPLDYPSRENYKQQFYENSRMARQLGSNAPFLNVGN